MAGVAEYALDGTKLTRLRPGTKADVWWGGSHLPLRRVPGGNKSRFC
jgi:hypothetical protein